MTAQARRLGRLQRRILVCVLTRSGRLSQRPWLGMIAGTRTPHSAGFATAEVVLRTALPGRNGESPVMRPRRHAPCATSVFGGKP
jgi:hypothetical protein